MNDPTKEEADSCRLNGRYVLLLLPERSCSGQPKPKATLAHRGMGGRRVGYTGRFACGCECEADPRVGVYR